MMHPAATRSIRIADFGSPASAVMEDVFRQYSDLVDARAAKVREQSGGKQADMRTGWLMWEDSLSEFLYFEERMTKPNPANFSAVWMETPAKGARKSSRSLWVFEKKSGKKRFSVTTSAGIKIQPYFDVPTPTDPNLCYFRVQSEPLGKDTILLWVSASTARALERQLGTLTRESLSQSVVGIAETIAGAPEAVTVDADLATTIPISKEAYLILVSTFEGVSDEHRVQLLLKALSA